MNKRSMHETANTAKGEKYPIEVEKERTKQMIFATNV